MWCGVRGVLIPKADGGRRPLSLAAIAWRIVAGAINRRLTLDAAATWAPPGLLGGISGRSVGEAHFLLASEVRLARMNGEDIAVISQDLEKAFDRTSAAHAAACLFAVGVPRGVCIFLITFYAQLERRMEVRGAVASSTSSRPG